MFFYLKRLLFLIPLLLISASLHAKTLHGIVRNINYSSHSFGLDVPPLIRVYVDGTSRFELPEGSGTFQSLQEGDRVEVKGKTIEPGIFVANRIKVMASLEPLKDLKSSEVSILPGQSFLLGVNQSAVLREEGKIRLQLQSTEFINTLCKNGYDCLGEGEVGMRLKVRQDKKEKEILLISKNHRKPTRPVKVKLFGFEIQLMEAGEDIVVLVVRQATAP